MGSHDKHPIDSQKDVTSPWWKGYVFFNGQYIAWKC